MKFESITAILQGALAAAMLMPANAENPNYAPGDLVLYFQQEGGTNTVYANLGNAATGFRGASAGPGATNQVNFKNVSAELELAFGAGWASDPTVYAGLAGVWGTDGEDESLQNGDPSRTLYVSKSRNSVGTVGSAGSTALNVNTDTGMDTGSSRIFNQNNAFDQNYLTAFAVSPTGTSNIDNQNPFLAPGVQDVAFGIFTGGVQQAGNAGSFGTFGAAGSVEFALDLYRILGKTGLPGQVAGNLRQGSFEGTVTVNSSGMVSFISQGAAGTPFQAWTLTFPALDTAAKRLPTADPDNDGLNNLMEFVLNGNPGISNPSIAPTLDASGSSFIFTFNRRDDSETGSTLRFQYGTDLTGWTDATIGTGNGIVGSATIVVTENATNPDAISVSVPKTVAPGGKLFGRLFYTQP